MIFSSSEIAEGSTYTVLVGGQEVGTAIAGEGGFSGGPGGAMGGDMGEGGMPGPGGGQAPEFPGGEGQRP